MYQQYLMTCTQVTGMKLLPAAYYQLENFSTQKKSVTVRKIAVLFTIEETLV